MKSEGLTKRAINAFPPTCHTTGSINGDGALSITVHMVGPFAIAVTVSKEVAQSEFLGGARLDIQELTRNSVHRLPVE